MLWVDDGKRLGEVMRNLQLVFWRWELLCLASFPQCVRKMSVVCCAITICVLDAITKSASWKQTMLSSIDEKSSVFEFLETKWRFSWWFEIPGFVWESFIANTVDNFKHTWEKNKIFCVIMKNSLKFQEVKHKNKKLFLIWCDCLLSILLCEHHQKNSCLTFNSIVHNSLMVCNCM